MTQGRMGASGAPVVSFENVRKVYGHVKAVDGLPMDLRPGETVAFLGPNGAGKSTSLDMLLDLRKPTSGTIRMFGSDPYHAIKAGRVGAMLQSGGLMPEVTVRELVALVTGFHPRPLPVEQTLKRAGIASFAGQRVDKLSGGQTQRVRFALAIVGECDLIVLDEPTAAMDVETRQAFWVNMKAEVAEGRTLLFATHYLEEADQAADRIIVINKGRLLADGTPSQIKARAGAKRISFRLDRIDAPFRPGAEPVHGFGPHPVRAPRRGLPAPRDRGVRRRAGAGVHRHHGRGRPRRQRHHPGPQRQRGRRQLRAALTHRINAQD